MINLLEIEKVEKTLKNLENELKDYRCYMDNNLKKYLVPIQNILNDLKMKSSEKFFESVILFINVEKSNIVKQEGFFRDNSIVYKIFEKFLSKNDCNHFQNFVKPILNKNNNKHEIIVVDKSFFITFLEKDKLLNSIQYFKNIGIYIDIILKVNGNSVFHEIVDCVYADKSLAYIETYQYKITKKNIENKKLNIKDAICSHMSNFHIHPIDEFTKLTTESNSNSLYGIIAFFDIVEISKKETILRIVVRIPFNPFNTLDQNFHKNNLDNILEIFPYLNCEKIKDD